MRGPTGLCGGPGLGPSRAPRRSPGHGQGLWQCRCAARDVEGSMIDAHGVTHPGRVRTVNEDALLVDEALRLFVVADGMGGHHAGDVASRIAVETVRALHVALRDRQPGVARRESPAHRAEGGQPEAVQGRRRRGARRRRQPLLRHRGGQSRIRAPCGYAGPVDRGRFLAGVDRGRGRHVDGGAEGDAPDAPRADEGARRDPHHRRRRRRAGRPRRRAVPPLQRRAARRDRA